MATKTKKAVVTESVALEVAILNPARAYLDGLHGAGLAEVELKNLLTGWTYDFNAWEIVRLAFMGQNLYNLRLFVHTYGLQDVFFVWKMYYLTFVVVIPQNTFFYNFSYSRVRKTLKKIAKQMGLKSKDVTYVGIHNRKVGQSR